MNVIPVYVLFSQEHKWIINKADGQCLDVDAKNRVVLNRCRQNHRRQMWEFGILNHTAFQTIGYDF